MCFYLPTTQLIFQILTRDYQCNAPRNRYLFVSRSQLMASSFSIVNLQFENDFLYILLLIRNL